MSRGVAMAEATNMSAAWFRLSLGPQAFLRARRRRWRQDSYADHTWCVMMSYDANQENTSPWINLGLRYGRSGWMDT